MIPYHHVKPTRRGVERRLDDLDDDTDARIFVVSIGGDSDALTGWLSPETYERHYDERPESDFTYMINGGGQE